MFFPSFDSQLENLIYLIMSSGEMYMGILLILPGQNGRTQYHGVALQSVINNAAKNYMPKATGNSKIN